MRKINVIKGDMTFQWKYGFYFLYALLVIIYMMIFSFFAGDLKNTIVSICVYSDPAAMGMFFMGALILLEKSQRIINSIAVSPVTTVEYIGGKVISIGIISEIVGLILVAKGYTENIVLSGIGIFLGSIIFSLCGIIVGAKISSLNQYIICTIPFEIVGFLPVIMYRLGFQSENFLMLIHPGCGVMQLIQGKTEFIIPSLVSIIIWIALLFVIANKAVKKMFRQSGGVKL